MISGVSFAQPSWLWFLLALPAFYLFLSRDLRGRRKQFERFAKESVWKQIAPELDWSARTRKARLWFLALGLVLVALARPQWGEREELVTVTGLDIVVVLDVSNSMLVEDVVPSRLGKAKHIIGRLVQGLSGDRVGLVAFAASSFLASPLTTDLAYLMEVVEIMNPFVVQNQGTDIGLALETAANALQRGAEDLSKEADEKAPSKVVVLISDGEDLEKQALEGAKQISEMGARLFVIGVGTQKGAPIPMVNRVGRQIGFKKKNGKVVMSQFSPKALKAIASQVGGAYWTASPSEGEVREILGAIGALDRASLTEKRKVIKQERYQIPLAIALLLFLLELSSPARRLLGASFAAVLVLLIGPSAYAVKPLEIYEENQKGVKAFEEGQLDEARQRFGKAQALDPERPELMFNQGVVQLEQQDLESAVDGFAGAARGALQEGNEALAGKSYYNLGSALARLGNMEGAVDSYLRGLQSAQKSGDQKLEKDLRERLGELIEIQKQQQQQQQKKEQSQNSQGGEGSEQQEKSEGEDQEKKDGDQKKQKELPEKYQKTKKQRSFKSQQLSKEDAERVLAELKNRERQLQTQKQSRRGEQQRSRGDDW